MTPRVISYAVAYRPLRFVLARLGYFHPLMLGPELFVDFSFGVAFKNGRKVPLKSVADV